MGCKFTRIELKLEITENSSACFEVCADFLLYLFKTFFFNSSSHAREVSEPPKDGNVWGFPSKEGKYGEEARANPQFNRLSSFVITLNK